MDITFMSAEESEASADIRLCRGKDNKTEICPDCGAREALEDFAKSTH